MAGGLLQLVANGEQDVYITGNPQITFFKVVYRKITPFTIESIEQTYVGNLVANNMVTVDIDRHGDLLSRVWLNIIHSDNNQSITTTDVNNPTSYYFREFSENDLGNGHSNDLVISDSGFVNISYSTTPPSTRLGSKSISISVSNDSIDNLIPIEILYSNASPELYTADFTVSMHFKITSNNKAQTILSTLDDSKGYKIHVTSDNKLGVRISDNIINFDNTININTWYFVLISNSKVIFGASDIPDTNNLLTTTVAGGYTSSENNIYIGRDHGENEEYFSGFISDLRFYDINVSDQVNTIVTTLANIVDVDSTLGRTDTFKDIEYVELEIGGQIIDKHYGEWMTIWCDLSNNIDKSNMLFNLDTDTSTYIPLQFWFCRNPGLALPLIALQYHEVKLNIKFSNLLKDNSKLKIICDYVFLDSDERRRFAEESHEYLIENVQTLPLHPLGNINEGLSANAQIDLKFNHPIKEIFWTVKNNQDQGILVDNAIIQINGHDRFEKRSGTYFNKVQRYQYHSGSTNNTQLVPHIYSFSENPEEYQPSGTCNFSMINDAKLYFKYTKSPFVIGSLFTRVYGLGYNLLRIISGMGGLAYAN